MRQRITYLRESHEDGFTPEGIVVGKSELSVQGLRGVREWRVTVGFGELDAEVFMFSFIFVFHPAPWDSFLVPRHDAERLTTEKPTSLANRRPRTMPRTPYPLGVRARVHSTTTVCEPCRAGVACILYSGKRWWEGGFIVSYIEEGV